MPRRDAVRVPQGLPAAPTAAETAPSPAGFTGVIFELMGELRLGTCSWKYPSWEGLVYSARERIDYLAEYASRYDYVEADQWFWSLGRRGVALPKTEVVAEYDAATGPDFRFAIKCPDAITLTHFRARAGEDLAPNPRFLDTGLFERFLESLGPLVAKTASFMFQFEYLNKDKMPSRDAFLERMDAFLGALPADLPYAVELRNPRWLDDRWFKTLSDLGVAPVLLQGYWMDDVADLLERLGSSMGSDAVCIRLHGEDREGMERVTCEDWSRVARPKDAELERIAPRLRELVGVGKRVYVNVNNHYEGCAPLTIEKLRALLRDFRHDRPLHA